MSAIKAQTYIVDDDGEIRRSIGFMLGTSGLPSRAFASGSEFLEAEPTLAPGCVLLDIRMPGMDGLEMLDRLRRGGNSWPVLVMTGHGEMKVAVQAMKLGAIDFLEKPFEEDLLLSCLRRGAGLLAERGLA